MLPTILVLVLVFCGKHRRLALKCPCKGWGLETLARPYFHPKFGCNSCRPNPSLSRQRCHNKPIHLTDIAVVTYQNVIATFHVIPCHQNEKIQFATCEVPWTCHLRYGSQHPALNFFLGPVPFLRVSKWLQKKKWLQKSSTGAHLSVPPLVHLWCFWALLMQVAFKSRIWLRVERSLNCLHKGSTLTALGVDLVIGPISKSWKKARICSPL